MKQSEVKSLIDDLVKDALGDHCGQMLAQDVRLALESAFVAGVRSSLRFTSDAAFADLFAGRTPAKKASAKK